MMKEEVPDNIVDPVRGVARGEQGWFSRRVGSRKTNLLQEVADDTELQRSIMRINHECAIWAGFIHKLISPAVLVAREPENSLFS
jgi:hypothetical protein